jgi:hypothetical protein
MGKPVRSSFQYLSISYECALAIGNSLNLSEMLHKKSLNSGLNQIQKSRQFVLRNKDDKDAWPPYWR